MTRVKRAWLRRCPSCGFLASDLHPRINRTDSALDEPAREVALETLRVGNAHRVLAALERAGLRPAARILDVGCGYGWFVAEAVSRGYDAAGLEPDREIAAAAIAAGRRVQVGFFPQALSAGERYDAIVFNDVFEHLPDPDAAIRAARDRLASDGLLAVNLPLSTGIGYRVASWLESFGIGGPFDRLWQVHFPSPHLSYFTQAQLAQLAATAGLVERSRGALRTLEARGLWARLRFDRSSNVVSAALTWLVLRPAVPVLEWLPADIGVQVFSFPPRRVTA